MGDRETQTIDSGDVGSLPEGLSAAPPVDELAGRRLDNEGDTKATNEMLVPAGRYSTKSATVREFAFKGRQPGETDRLMFGVSASIVLAKDATLENGDGSKVTLRAGEYEDEIEFMYSHQRRDRDDGTPDSAYKKYLQLKAAYKTAMQTDPTTVDDIKSYIESYPVSLRVTRFDGKNWVQDLGAVRV